MYDTIVSVARDYWSGQVAYANVLIFCNMLGALLLGLLVGYERSYHGRAAGMRTYGLVCMASAALTVICGYPAQWFGGQVAIAAGADPTRVIQGVVTGIGFLGAGVIMKEGFTISGLTTAASIWASAAIGVLVGVGFYGAAITMAVMCTLCMVSVSWLQNWLPARPAIAAELTFRKGFEPKEDTLRRLALERGYEIAGGTLQIRVRDAQPEWQFVAVALDKSRGASISELAHELTQFEGVESFQLSHSRN